MNKRIIVLLGPTASGKTAKAIQIAKNLGAWSVDHASPERAVAPFHASDSSRAAGTASLAQQGVIINADAMQAYADLHVLSARPSTEEMQDVPHEHFGVWEARFMGNAQAWQDAVIPMIHAAHAHEKTPILVGGTGMYVKGLYEGLAKVPEPDAKVRDAIALLSAQQAWQALQQEDSAMAAQLEPGDTQRVKRALEVLRSSGKSLAEYQALPTQAPFAKAQFDYYAMQVDREALYAKIDARFEQMMHHGALEEVQALAAHFTPNELQQARFPVLKAIGVPELLAYLDGTLTQQDALELAQRNTRRYAKRQMTWIRGQVPDVQWLTP